MADKHLDGLVNIPDARARYDRAWRGRVSRVSGASAWVVVAGIAPNYEFGPCDTRGVSDIAQGDSVMVEFINGDPRDPIIARRLQDTAHAAEDIANVPSGSLAATDVQAAINALVSRVEALESQSHTH